MSNKHRAIIVNMSAGSGAGKSTNSARLFAMLKDKGIEVELVTEFAKDLVWEGRDKAFECQPYIFGKQLYRIQRVSDSVDVIITDSPIFLSAIYDREQDINFKNFILSQMNNFDNLNIYLNRVKPFNPNGRNEGSIEEAKVNDRKVLDFLNENKIEYKAINGDAEGCERIFNLITDKLRNKNIKGEIENE